MRRLLLEANVDGEVDVASLIQDCPHFFVARPEAISDERNQIRVVPFQSWVQSSSGCIFDLNHNRVVVVTLKPRVMVPFHKCGIRRRPIDPAAGVAEQVKCQDSERIMPALVPIQFLVRLDAQLLILRAPLLQLL